MSDYYAMLGITEDASMIDIKAAYHRLALQLHPDVTASTGRVDTRFQQVTTAYRVLSHPAQRAAYDQARSAVPRPLQPRSVPQVAPPHPSQCDPRAPQPPLPEVCGEQWVALPPAPSIQSRPPLPSGVPGATSPTPRAVRAAWWTHYLVLWWPVLLLYLVFALAFVLGVLGAGLLAPSTPSTPAPAL